MRRWHGWAGTGAALALSATMAWGADAPAAGASAPAAAGDDGTRAKVGAVFKACDADLKSLCGGKDGPEGMMCLISNKQKVSAACKSALDALPPPPQGGGGGGPPPAGGGPPPAGATPPKQ